MTASPTTSSQTATVQRAENLYALALILVVISSLVHFIWGLSAMAWALAVSGGLIALSMMLKSAFERKHSGSAVRSRRLDRMRMLGGLLFMVAGGFAIEGQNLWILLFAGGTVFTLYGIFVEDKIKL